jgi:acyl-CoA synthetase
LITETSGRSCSGYEIRIWQQDDPDREVPPGEIGQIGGRGASLMLGYFDDQRATEAAFNRAGWFMTGDLGWVDEDGYLRITGRLKDIILRGGHNIHPARIEALALRHPAIAKAAAFGVPDERLGERVCLAIVAGTGETPTPEAILRHLDEAGLSRYEMPEYVLVLPELPLTASGKVTKRELKRSVAEGRYRPVPVRYRRLGAAAAKV